MLAEDALISLNCSYRGRGSAELCPVRAPLTARQTSRANQFFPRRGIFWQLVKRSRWPGAGAATPHQCIGSGRTRHEHGFGAGIEIGTGGKHQTVQCTAKRLLLCTPLGAGEKNGEPGLTCSHQRPERNVRQKTDVGGDRCVLEWKIGDPASECLDAGLLAPQRAQWTEPVRVRAANDARRHQS